MPRNTLDISLLLAVGGSLAVHAALLVGSQHVRVEGPRGSIAPRSIERQMIVSLEPAKAPAPPAKLKIPQLDQALAMLPTADDVQALLQSLATAAEVKTPPPPAPELAKKDPAPANEFVVGDKNGRGYATHEVKSDRVASAPLAESDQPFMSRDPVGEFGQSAAAKSGQERASPPAPPREAVAVKGAQPIAEPLPRPSPIAGSSPNTEIRGSVAIPQLPGDAGAHGPVGVGVPDQPVSPRPAALARASLPVAVIPPSKAVVPLPRDAANDQPAPRDDALRPPTEHHLPDAVAQAGASQSSPFSGKAAGDPAPPTDSEVDPFSQFGGAVVREGRLEVREGRKVKPRKPDLKLAEMVDAATMGDIRIVARISIDASGKVTSVTIIKSTGSRNLDSAVRVSLYDWWFEPRNSDGTSGDETFEFPITFK